MISDKRCPACNKVSTFMTNFPGPFERLKVKCESCGAEIYADDLTTYNATLERLGNAKLSESEFDRAVDTLHKFYAEALGKNLYNPMAYALHQAWLQYRKESQNGRQEKDRESNDQDQ